MEIFLVFFSGFASYFLARRHQKSKILFALIGILFPLVGLICLWIFVRSTAKNDVSNKLSNSLQSSSAIPTSSYLAVKKSGGFFQEVVGESNYVGNIRKIVGKGQSEVIVSAELIREPNNQFDKNAVRVDIAGLTVGYLPREDAKNFHELINFALRQRKKLIVQARVWFGGEIGSVRLDIGEPAFSVLVNPEDLIENSICWPYGSKVQVTKENDYLVQISKVKGLGFSESGCTAYFELTGSIDSKNRPQISILFRGEKVGELSTQASAKYWTVLEKCLTMKNVFAVGEVRSNSLAAEIVLYMKSPEQLGVDELNQLTS